ncbi:hypothetical protein [Brevibacillus laterosporus]|uniref:hypothetical protein n=1 Tax=Brevibacillus laterosporus TaxID=1465 RepID=UPI000362AF8E|nr:hypothetical protein [Brevibacillus laterosporus]ATO49449.1 hypothetical protein BrL25_10180 [Brevibacillus laterosporus DSM 25]AYB40453.1 hypothetical protein D5F52_20685 [Brevibacillus laterosporus]MBG9772299.1 hypothetical protein [Brevibacillus laterosporus]MBG9799064.1 hypothetical protein [Brevibacillus laterosporus]MBG9802104.1 hypothetical protein [Brevibacillus laterosporus]
MKEQTIYSYRLLYRFRWGISGYLLQLIGIITATFILGLWQALTWYSFILFLCCLIFIPLLHMTAFWVYASILSRPFQLSSLSWLSPWWGVTHSLMVSLANYRKMETVTCLGVFFTCLAIFPWSSFPYGHFFVIITMFSLLPRLIPLLVSFRHPREAYVKYEKASLAFLMTDGKS